MLGLDQKKAFDYISREYLWCTMSAYGFPSDFINICKLLYTKSTVHANVNGVITERCPLTAAL